MDNQETSFGKVVRMHALGSGMDSPTPSTIIFSMADLEALPDRLDNETMRALRTFMRSPPRCAVPCETSAFAECMRTMAAVLPRQTGMDEVGGKLMVAVYHEHLGHFSEGAIRYLAKQSVARCRWFPTVAECIEIATACPVGRITWKPDVLEDERARAVALVQAEDALRLKEKVSCWRSKGE